MPNHLNQVEVRTLGCYRRSVFVCWSDSVAEFPLCFGSLSYCINPMSVERRQITLRSPSKCPEKHGNSFFCQWQQAFQVLRQQSNRFLHHTSHLGWGFGVLCFPKLSAFILSVHRIFSQYYFPTWWNIQVLFGQFKCVSRQQWLHARISSDEHFLFSVLHDVDVTVHVEPYHGLGSIWTRSWLGLDTLLVSVLAQAQPTHVSTQIELVSATTLVDCYPDVF